MNKIAFEIFGMQVAWYSIMYLMSLWIIYFYVQFILNKLSFKIIDLTEIIFILFIFGVIGARLFYCFVYFPYFYINYPYKVMYIWEGGLSFHGSVIGVIFGCLYIQYIQKIRFLFILDITCLVSPIIIMLVRVGNFINGELYGRVTLNKYIGVDFHGDGILRHPSQLYESFFEGFLMIFIMYYIFKYFYFVNYNVVLKKYDLNVNFKFGNVSFIFLIIYSIFRFLLEFFRQPDIQIGYVFYYLTYGQIISVICIIISIIYLYYINK